ncbi:ABC transporter ATP-binding protein [Streptomyces sp. ACA25]|uniref:ATP-binding cassette domain-containing protein n=1 Tax=Streptomyces sp. ACA25 TaxID=3022596 RepID=UPI0023081EE9|nr:ABC transporter ATP-binding protein [Streptomyces sp. ACA25]MDB1087789.1 ABC transporter ATP-binding protein [Streptomyces sp. ACA25]
MPQPETPAPPAPGTGTPPALPCGAGDPPAARSGLVAAGLRFLRRRPRAVLALGGWSLLESAQTFLLGYGIARALDDGFLRGDTATGLVWLAVAAMGVLAGAVGAGRVLRAVAALAEPLRDLLVRRIVGRSLHEAVGGVRPDSTAVVSRLTHQAEIARDSFAGLVLITQSFVFTAAGALAGLLWLAPVMLLIVLPPLLLGLALFGWSLRPLARRQRAFLEADEEIAAALGETAGGLRDVVAAGAEDRMLAETGERIGAGQRTARALARWTVTRVVALAVGGWLPVVLLLLLAPWLLSRGVTAGALVGALTYLMQSLLPALQSLVQGLGGAGARLAVVVGRLRGGAPDPDPGPDGDDPPRPPGAAAEAPAPGGPPAAVELRQVTFGYGERSAPVLHGLDLEIPQGEHLAVVGPSGTGKSTLAGLVAGLLEPRQGRIRVCGMPASGPGPAHRARLRALVPQEAYVFDGTVRDNLVYLCPGQPVPEQRLLTAAAAVGAGPLLERLGGPDGRVDPGRLSAGERQLLALARTYLSPAPVVVLDEATCHLDPVVEDTAERAFANRPGGTLLVIAHRISSALRADRVLLLDGSRARCGSHEELLRSSAGYRELTGSWSQPTRLLGYADGVDPVAGAGLPGDRGHVVAHRAAGQMQRTGYLGKGGPLGGE